MVAHRRAPQEEAIPMELRRSASVAVAAAALLLAPVGAASAQEAADTGALTAVDLGTLGGEQTMPLAVNNRGQVVLQRLDAQGSLLESLLWHRGRTTSLGDVLALVVNDRGQVAGNV